MESVSFASKVLLVGAIVAVVVFVPLFARAFFMRAQRLGRQEVELSEAKRIVTGKSICVVIAKPDGKQTTVENLIVEALLDAGMKV